MGKIIKNLLVVCLVTSYNICFAQGREADLRPLKGYFQIERIDSTKHFYLISTKMAKTNDSVLIISDRSKKYQHLNRPSIRLNNRYLLSIYLYPSKVFLDHNTAIANGLSIKLDERSIPVEYNKGPFKTDDLKGLKYDPEH